MSFLTSAVRRTSLRLSLSLRAAFNLCYMCMKWVSKESLLFIIYYPMDGFAKYRGRERLKMWMRLDTRERLLTFFFEFFLKLKIEWLCIAMKNKVYLQKVSMFFVRRTKIRRFETLRDTKMWRCCWNSQGRLQTIVARIFTKLHHHYHHAPTSSFPSYFASIFLKLNDPDHERIEKIRSSATVDHPLSLQNSILHVLEIYLIISRTSWIV